MKKYVIVLISILFSAISYGEMSKVYISDKIPENNGLYIVISDSLHFNIGTASLNGHVLTSKYIFHGIYVKRDSLYIVTDLFNRVQMTFVVRNNAIQSLSGFTSFSRIKFNYRYDDSFDDDRFNDPPTYKNYLKDYKSTIDSFSDISGKYIDSDFVKDTTDRISWIKLTKTHYTYYFSNMLLFEGNILSNKNGIITLSNPYGKEDFVLLHLKGNKFIEIKGYAGQQGYRVYQQFR